MNKKNQEKDRSRTSILSSHGVALSKKNISHELGNDQIVIYGKHSVFEAIKVKKRKIFTIYATSRSFESLKISIDISSIPIQKIKIVDDAFIDKICGKDKVHQGIAIIAAKIVPKSYDNLISDLKKFDDIERKPTILILDELTDPQNVGAIIRSAVAFGVKKIVICAHNASFENAAINKASAGMIEYVDLFVISGINNLIERLKSLRYWCVGLASEGENKISEINDYKNIALIVGSEGRGLRSLIKKNCDFLLSIKMNNEVESLNASVACAIVLHQLYT